MTEEEFIKLSYCYIFIPLSNGKWSGYIKEIPGLSVYGIDAVEHVKHELDDLKLKYYQKCIEDGITAILPEPSMFCITREESHRFITSGIYKGRSKKKIVGDWM